MPLFMVRLPPDAAMHGVEWLPVTGRDEIVCAHLWLPLWPPEHPSRLYQRHRIHLPVRERDEGRLSTAAVPKVYGNVADNSLQHLRAFPHSEEVFSAVGRNQQRQLNSCRAAAAGRGIVRCGGGRRGAGGAESGDWDACQRLSAPQLRNQGTIRVGLCEVVCQELESSVALLQ
jgi:hypothetical protein